MSDKRENEGVAVANDMSLFFIACRDGAQANVRSADSEEERWYYQGRYDAWLKAIEFDTLLDKTATEQRQRALAMLQEFRDNIGANRFSSIPTYDPDYDRGYEVGLVDGARQILATLGLLKED